MHDPSLPIYPAIDTASLRAWVDVDLDALRRNAARLARRAGVPLMPMIKADGYGLGMVPVARALGAEFGASTGALPKVPIWGLGVATLDEAATLRAAGCTARVLCTTPITPAEHPQAAALAVRPALHRADDIDAWCQRASHPWHLAIDTGMARAGVRWDAVAGLADTIRRHPPEGVFTHFHSAECADGSRVQQDERFAAALTTLADALPDHVLRHRDNSAGIAARGTSSDAFVRPGIGVYGASVTPWLALEPVAHLRARVVDLRTVRDGETVSYNGTWQASGPRRIATIAAGYGDGYRRALSNTGQALLHGTRVPVVGNVTMDMVMLDVTALGDRCAVGDVVTLLGRDGDDTLTADAVAASGGLSPYELLVGLRLRAVRRYLISQNAFAYPSA